MSYFLYARKSEEDDGRQVQSIGDQLRLGLELAHNLDLNISEVFHEARSAKRPGRSVFNEMIARIEAGEARGIIAWHPDRLSRNAVDAGMLIDLLDRGVLYNLKFGSYTFENSPEGKWMLNIVLSQSKYFVDKLSKDVKRGLRSKIQKGHFPGKAPTGYRNDLFTHTIVPDPERFEPVQRALRLFATGAYSASEVVAVLNEQWGFRTHQSARTRGTPLSRSAFYHMLSNPFYCGLMLLGGELHPGAHKPMLSQHEFDSIQELLKRGRVAHSTRKDLKAPRPKHLFDFGGLMTCGTCGCRVTAEAKVKSYPSTGRTRTYVYYHCTNGRGGCTKRGITQEQVEMQVAGLLEKIAISPNVLEWCLAPAQRWHASQSDRDNSALDSLLRSLSGAERKKSNLFNERLTHPDLYSMEEFREQKEHLQSEINRLTREIKATRERLESVRETVENVFDFALHAKENFEKGDTRLRKEIAGRLGLRYCLTLGKLEIQPHPLLLPLLAFEPPKNGSYNKKDGSLEAVRLSWQAVSDQIRNRALEQGLLFAKFNWLHHVT